MLNVGEYPVTIQTLSAYAGQQYKYSPWLHAVCAEIAITSYCSLSEIWMTILVYELFPFQPKTDCYIKLSLSCFDKIAKTIINANFIFSHRKC